MDPRIEQCLQNMVSRQNNGLYDELEIKEGLQCMNYFQKLMKNQDSHGQLDQCVKAIQYQYFPKGKFLFHAGDNGEKFYFVLKGSAAVFVPKNPIYLKNELEWLRVFDLNKENLENEFLSEYQQKEYNQELERAQHVLESIRITQRDKDLLLKETQFIKKYFTNDLRLCFFQRVNTMLPTTHFGEVAAGGKCTRTATVIAQEDLHVGVIHSHDYMRIFEKQLNKINFMMGILNYILPNTYRNTLANLAYQFKEKWVNLHQCIYLEGSSADNVYLIEQGQIGLKQKRQIQKQEEEETQEELDAKVSEEFQINNKKGLMKSFLNPKKSDEEVIICLEKGSFFGLENCVKGINYFTAECLSSEAQIYEIKVDNFDKDEDWAEVLKRLRKISMNQLQYVQNRFEDLEQFRVSNENSSVLARAQQSQRKSLNQRAEERNQLKSLKKSLFETTNFELNFQGHKLKKQPQIMPLTFSKKQQLISKKDQLIDSLQQMLKQNNQTTLEQETTPLDQEKKPVMKKQRKASMESLASLNIRNLPKQVIYDIVKFNGKLVKTERKTRPLPLSSGMSNFEETQKFVKITMSNSSKNDMFKNYHKTLNFDRLSSILRNDQNSHIMPEKQKVDRCLTIERNNSVQSNRSALEILGLIPNSTLNSENSIIGHVKDGSNSIDRNTQFTQTNWNSSILKSQSHKGGGFVGSSALNNSSITNLISPYKQEYQRQIDSFQGDSSQQVIGKTHKLNNSNENIGNYAYNFNNKFPSASSILIATSNTTRTGYESSPFKQQSSIINSSRNNDQRNKFLPQLNLHQPIQNDFQVKIMEKIKKQRKIQQDKRMGKKISQISAYQQLYSERTSNITDSGHQRTSFSPEQTQNSIMVFERVDWMQNEDN